MKTFVWREGGMPMAPYLAETPEPKSKTNESPLPSSTKTLLASCAMRGRKLVPRSVMRM
jgi:hypothetical protein